MIAKFVVRFAAVPVCVLPIVVGCEGLSHTENGALAGAGLGAGAGAIISKATGHNGLPGALIGGALGAVAGGVTGNAIEKSEQRSDARAAAVAQAHAMGMIDVVQMTQQHISDAIIINQIRSSGSVFQLSPADLSYLKANGVSDPVVIEMQATARRPQHVYTTPVYTRPVYVVEQPPPVVGVGFGYRGRW